ncbi:MAG: serine/threonine protein kinase, partial [Muribaculaceae bacterium]
SLPTKAQMEELDSKCTWEGTTLNGVKGVKVTGPNGNSIFMPCAGFRNGSTLYEQGKNGFYWSSTPSLNNDVFAYDLTFNDNGDSNVFDNYVIDEFSVRTVAEK